MERLRRKSLIRGLAALALAPLALALFSASPAAAAEEQVIDGSFEAESPSWTFAEGEKRCESLCGVPAATGSYYAASMYPNTVPPGPSFVGMGSLSQALPIPASPATLTFQLRQEGEELLSEELRVEYAGEALTEIFSASSTFSKVTIPIPATLIGPAVRPLTFKVVCFQNVSMSGHCDRFDIDDVSLMAGPEPTPPGGGGGPGGGGQPPADTTPPDTKIAGAATRTVHVASRHSKAGGSVRFSSEPGARFECKLDGKPYAACVSPKKLKLKLGRHVFRVRAVDQAGNVDPTPAKATIKVKLSG